MQETWEFDLRESFLPLGKQFSKEAFKNFMEQREKELGIFLSYYYQDEGGLVEEVKFGGKLNFHTPASGSFNVSFKVVYFNACLDIHADNTGDMLLCFDLDRTQKRLKLSGPYWPEREPDEI